MLTSWPRLSRTSTPVSLRWSATVVAVVATAAGAVVVDVVAVVAVVAAALPAPTTLPLVVTLAGR